jgi:small subunit ribosomal protein S8e
MQPFEWIGPDSTSMDGPVTYARAMRGEIPKRPGNPEQRLKTAEKNTSSDMMDADGLKLRIELNVDVEIELKARIQGDLTLALL